MATFYCIELDLPLQAGAKVPDPEASSPFQQKGTTSKDKVSQETS